MTGVFADDLIQNVPDFGTLFLDQFLGLLDRGRQALGLEPGIDERLEQFERHLFRQAALMQLQLRSRHDDGPARKVDALAQKVLAEAALLALEHVGQRFQRALVGTRNDAAATAVVEQRIDGFLQHPLFVAHDDVGRAQFDQPLQAVVAVDDPAIQIVQVRCGEPAPVERHQRAQLGWDDRDDRQDHPLRTVAGFDEALDDLQTLDDLLGLQLSGGFLQVFTKGRGFLLQVDGGQHFADGFGTDVRLEGVGPEVILRVHELLLGHQLSVGEVGQARFDHDVVLEIQDAFQIAQRHVQHQADARGQRLEEPDVRDGRGQLDVAHPLAADLLQRDFDAAFLADDAAILHALVLAAQAFVVLDRTEDARAEKTVTFGLERAVVDGLGLLDLAVGPRENPLRAGQRDLDLVEDLLRGDRVERVVRQFLVHLDTFMKRVRWGTWGARETRPIG
jgi:hypothetical protein